jgi:alpha-beta hydrolase superfamily lysophospholipase
MRGRLERWEAVRPARQRSQVTAMDQRGDGSSDDTKPYRLSKEFDDVEVAVTSLARDTGGLADTFAHSSGATCLIGAAARGTQVRRIATYEPPGPQTVPWAPGASTSTP